jgi:hypothetical protein
MVGKLAVCMVVIVGACAVDAVEPAPREPVATALGIAVDLVDPTEAEPDICGLAAALPAEDICSLACDPEAFADRLVADGAVGGRCLQLYCQLAPDVSVWVGACLP